jgi:membrane protein YqaA with SNARE-associated domain
MAASIRIATIPEQRRHMGISIRPFAFFLTWWGLVLLGALDASLLVFVPFGTDAAVIYLCARDREWFWLYPLLITAGSIGGAVVTYGIGARISEKALSRFVSPRKLGRFQARLKVVGPFTMGLSAVLPPPFPLTAFVLMSGALKVPLTRFLAVFAAARLVRFGAEALLARRFGTSLLRMLESEPAQQVAIGLVVVSIVGTAITIFRVWRSSKLPTAVRSRS